MTEAFWSRGAIGILPTYNTLDTNNSWSALMSNINAALRKVHAAILGPMTAKESYSKKPCNHWFANVPPGANQKNWKIRTCPRTVSTSQLKDRVSTEHDLRFWYTSSKEMPSWGIRMYVCTSCTRLLCKPPLLSTCIGNLSCHAMPHKLWYLITVAPMSSVVAVDLQRSQWQLTMDVKAALQSQATNPEAGSEQYDKLGTPRGNKRVGLALQGRWFPNWCK